VKDGNATGKHPRKYVVLLALLLVSLVVESADVRGAGRYLSDLFRMVLGVTIWFVVFKRPRARVATAAIAVAATALN
jgi:hypothetical protein